MIIWATQFLLEKAYNTIYIDKRFKNIFFRLKNQKANKKDANHTFFTSSFMSSTTAEAWFSMAFFVLWVDPLMFNKVWTQIKFFPRLCISNSLFPHGSYRVYKGIRAFPTGLPSPTSTGSVSSQVGEEEKRHFLYLTHVSEIILRKHSFEKQSY